VRRRERCSSRRESSTPTAYGQPSTGKLIGRYFAYLVSIIPIFLGFLWIAVDKRKQGWHDKLAGTVVIYDEDDGLGPRSLAIGTETRKGADMSWGFWIVVGIVVAAVVWLISIYNGLVAQRNRFKNAFAQIDVQLKRRYDLIPNLVETAKGYIKHERGTLEAVITARNGAQSANQRAAANPADAEAMKQMAAAEAGLSGALGRLFALSEAYPDLKANQTMMQLSEELTSTENKISFARQAYNDAVMSYNTAIESFPNNFVAGSAASGRRPCSSPPSLPRSASPSRFRSASAAAAAQWISSSNSTGPGATRG